MFKNPLQPGDATNNSKLVEIFGCSPQGGMRRSLKTKTLVIVSNHVSSIYSDRWDGNILHYTGMGQTDDQVLTGNQNKTLNESGTNGVAVHLFEVHRDGEYTYSGEVELASPPYREKQPDSTGKTRNVWVFPVQLTSGGTPTVVSWEEYQANQQRREKKVAQLGDAELKGKLPADGKKPEKRKTHTYSYSRDPHVVTAALRRAMGKCQLCDSDAPFKKRGGEPFLEVHHIKPLAKGGEDTLRNAIALCPNCHRKMHALNKKADLKKLAEAAAKLGVYA
jgi:5-methylcytosine-specific restriction protein A